MENVQSLSRGLAVIRAFDDRHPRMTSAEVARQTGLTRATARRLLLTLVELGYVSADEREFSLTPRVLELGYSYLSSISLPDLAMAHLTGLAGSVDESASMAVLDGSDIVFVAMVPVKRVLTVTLGVGTRFPAAVTAMGRVLVAGLPMPERQRFLDGVELSALTPHTITSRTALEHELERIAEQGWAIVDQEFELELLTVAAPIREESGRVVAAINVSSSARRSTVEAMREQVLPSVLECARQIERDYRLGQFERATLTT